MTTPASVAGLAEAVGDTLHVLVNNAGGAFGADPVATADPEQWRAMYDVNVLGTLHVTQALLPALRASAATVWSSTSARPRAGSPTRAAAATPPRSTAPRC